MASVYEKEFKIMIAELILSGRPVKEVSLEYGLNGSMVRRWRREYEQNSGQFPTRKELSPLELENKELKKKLADIQEERDILKKAANIFSKSDGTSTLS